ncbi:MAG: SIMPL domain-containing protein [Ignavibacteriae bacterium]|nr:SIMPL domain-containing protein [Ignavibacteriota bacterium]
MDKQQLQSAFITGFSLFLGLTVLGILLGNAAVRFKSFERAVVVKGLSEREIPANIVIWPVTFQDANNNLTTLFESIQKKSSLVIDFMTSHGITREEITIAPPAVVDRYAQTYGSTERVSFRYTATSTVTVYSTNVDQVRKAMSAIIDLGKKGVAIYGEDYRNRTQFLFTGLNDLKPAMIEEATKNARAVAEKFAQDSESELGKIKSALQGQFSIDDRDATTPHIKKVRVVSTVEYYLSD